LAIARAYQVNKENYIKKPKDEDKKWVIVFVDKRSLMRYNVRS
jgi:hypothetical protein